MSSVGVSENVGSSIVLVRVLVFDLGLRRLPVEESRARARLRIEERRIGMDRLPLGPPSLVPTQEIEIPHSPDAKPQIFIAAALVCLTMEIQCRRV